MIDRKRCLVPFASAVLLALGAGCAGNPAAPSGSHVTRVDVVPGDDLTTTVVSGQSLQLRAVVTYADGRSADGTTAVVWQSSNPSAGIVGQDGVLKTAQAGSLEVTATLAAVAGVIRIEVTEPQRSCGTATLSSEASSHRALASLVRVSVTVPFSECRWTAQSDAPWLALGGVTGRTLYDPGRSGNGDVAFWTNDNNFPATRTAHLRVTFTDGTTLVHTVTQAPPPTCSYIVQPAEHAHPATGGAGSFTVVTTPQTCSWTAVTQSSYTRNWNLQLQNTNGIGTGTVTYTVAPPPHTFDLALPIEVRGPNPDDPRAVFTVKVPRS